MNILLATTGSAGDVFPFIAIGRALAERSHHVTLIAPSEFQAHAQRNALDFVSLHTHECKRAYIDQESRCSLARKLWAGFIRSCTGSWRKLARASTVVPLLRPVYQAIAQRVVPGQTVVVASAPLLGARVAHDKLKVPLVTVHLSPVGLRSAKHPPLQPPLRLPSGGPAWCTRLSYCLLDRLILDPLLAGPLNQLRAELGLPCVTRVLHTWRHSPQLVLGLFPSWFAKPEPDWPTTLRLTGFLSYDRGLLSNVPDAVEEFFAAGPPPILITPGSAISRAQRFFEESIRACLRMGRRALLVTPHREQIPATLPTAVRHFDYLPFSRILPRVAALVHTGGIGTAAQALAAGIPQVIMPLKNDQPDNAKRLEDLGVARILYPRTFHAGSLTKALTVLQTSELVATRCRTLARQLKGADPLAETCLLIERLLSRRILQVA